MCVKSVICNFQVFLPTNILKRSAIADDRPLFATLHIEVFNIMICRLVWLRPDVVLFLGDWFLKYCEINFTLVLVVISMLGRSYDFFRLRFYKTV